MKSLWQSGLQGVVWELFVVIGIQTHFFLIQDEFLQNYPEKFYQRKNMVNPAAKKVLDLMCLISIFVVLVMCLMSCSDVFHEFDLSDFCTVTNNNKVKKWMLLEPEEIFQKNWDSWTFDNFYRPDIFSKTECAILSDSGSSYRNNTSNYEKVLQNRQEKNIFR